jgi:hypothetical protein
MRPRGEIRAALSAAAMAMAPVAEARGVTYLELAASAQVGYDVARATVKDMVKAGELVPVGDRRVPGIKRPLRTYTARQAANDASAAHQLGHAMRGWVTNF